MTRWKQALAIAVALAGTPAPMAVGQATTPTDAPESVPVVWMMQSGSYGGGSTGSIALGTSDWYEALLYAGDTREGNICGGGATGPRTGPAVMPDGASPIVTWRVAVRRQAFDGGTATIDVRWSRNVEGADIQPANDFEGAFTWQAAEGDERVLDLVRQVPVAQAGCETQSLTLRYQPDGPDELSEAAIGYDIWLVQGLPSGERRTRHLQTAARQGDVVRFAFPAVGVDAPGLKNAAGPPILDVTVQGLVRGRQRRDGRIDIAVDAGRLVWPRGRGLGSGNSGRTRLTVAQGETVELQPPPIHGDTDGPYADALRRAPTAIRVRARRLW